MFASAFWICSERSVNRDIFKILFKESKQICYEPFLSQSLIRSNRFSFSVGMAWCSHANMSPMYRLGSWACISIGFGFPPGPPTVRASMNDRTSTERRAVAYSSITYLQKYSKKLRWTICYKKCIMYLNKTGRSCNRLIACTTNDPTSWESIFRQWLCVHRYNRSKAPSWCSVISSIISNAAVWYPLCISIRQSAWMDWTRSKTVKNSGVIGASFTAPYSVWCSARLSWNRDKNAPAICWSIWSLLLSAWSEFVCWIKSWVRAWELRKFSFIEFTDFAIASISLHMESSESFTSRNDSRKFSLMATLRFSIWLRRFRRVCKVFSVKNVERSDKASRVSWNLPAFAGYL